MSRVNYVIRYSIAKMFAAKFRVSSIAKVFAITGKDLSRPLNRKDILSKKSVIGQREEKIHEYLTSIGVSASKLKDRKRYVVGIPFTSFKDIPHPDLAPLKKDFNPTFMETLTSSPNNRQVNPLNSLN